LEQQLSNNYPESTDPHDARGGNTASNARSALRADTLADSVVILLSLTIFQKVVGFGRQILFCRWLEPDELGLWGMALNFLMISAPLAVLALPGTFERYAERYRRQGQLRRFLKRTAVACALMALAAAAIVWIGRAWFSYQIFGTPEKTELVVLLGVCMLVLIVFNYFMSLCTALRNVRLVSAMQVVNVFAFAGLAVALLLGWQCTVASAIAAYAGAAVIAILPAAWWLRGVLREIPSHEERLADDRMWKTLVPFAGWILLINMLTNLFEMADQYMILHYASASKVESAALVGNYYSSRLMPLLLVSIAGMLAAVLTPHLSHDWEEGKKERVCGRLNLFIKVTAFGLMALAAAVMLAAPLLFGVALKDKFGIGLSVLPWTLTYCIWFSLIMVAQKYLWCAEKAGLAGAALAVGLVANIVLNMLLLPIMGLLGAVLATSAANLIALVLILAFNRMLGFRADRAVWVLLAAPLALCLGPLVSCLVLLAILLEVFNSDRILSRDEKQQLINVCLQYIDRFAVLRKALSKASG